MKKNGKVLILEIIVIILAIVGITLAISYIMNSIGLSTTNASVAVDYTGSTTLPSTTLFPISDSSVSSNTSNVLRVNFTVKGVSTNPSDRDIIYDIVLDDLNLPCYLKNEYLKWRLIKNGTTLTEGNFSPTFDIIEDGRLYLTTTQQDLPAYNATADSYQLLIWISEACNNLTNCSNYVDQKPMMGEAISGKIQILIHGESKTVLTRSTGSALTCDSIYDKSGANSPDLVQGLIPVKYDNINNVWVKADITNNKKKWYNYDEKRWANAVLVSNTNRSTYQSAEVGTPIPESDVLAYYVWIPRYKYKVWNITKTIGTDTYNAKNTGVDIVFENETQSTGTIACNYNFAITDGSLSEICTGSNGDYYTHPAFTFGDKQLRGIWVGKFEMSANNTIMPNSWASRGLDIDYNWYLIDNMQKVDNKYGLSTSRSNTDSHMIRNMEWGAVAYLTNSKYGRCSNNSCTSVSGASSSNHYTGGNDYVANIDQTTTGNIYGIYDMNGGSQEWVMGNMSSTIGYYTFYPSEAEDDYEYDGYEKYIDTYAYGSSYSDQTAYNRSRLGDATGEITEWIQGYYSKYFVLGECSWFIRYGVFSFGCNTGEGDEDEGARAVLVSMQ